MKKIIPLIFTLLISSSIFGFQQGEGVSVICPHTTIIRDAITKNGSMIYGTGSENVIGSVGIPIMFTSQALPPHLANDLSQYDNRAVRFNSKMGDVICDYSSHLPHSPQISVSYHNTAFVGAKIMKQAEDYIDLQFAK